MTNKEIKVGDVVSLNSDNGPVMDVESVIDGIANCVWFDHKIKHTGSFRVEVLKVYTPRKLTGFPLPV